jgi:hypothetical protein
LTQQRVVALEQEDRVDLALGKRILRLKHETCTFTVLSEMDEVNSLHEVLPIEVRSRRTLNKRPLQNP